VTNHPPSRARRVAVTGWWLLVGLVVLAVIGADLMLLPAHAVGPADTGSPRIDDPLRVLLWTVVMSAGR
jgi:hypothetical protein